VIVRVLVGVLGGAIVALMLLEIFLSFLLPRRVKRDPRMVRWVFAYGWRPWRGLARRLPAQAGDTMLGLYGPLGLLLNLALWVLAMMLGYACLQWAGGSHLGVPRGTVDFGNDLYFSAATMTTDGPSSLAAQSTFARAVQVIDAGSGLAVLAIVMATCPPSTRPSRAARRPSPNWTRAPARRRALGGWCCAPPGAAAGRHSAST